MPAPFVVASLLVIAGAARAVALAADPGPFAALPAAVLAVSLLVHTLIAATGLLIARGRWARHHGLAIVAVSLAASLAVPLSGWSAAATVAAGAALGGLAGPWLQRGWLRHLPSADGPPPAAVATVLGLLAVPAIAAAALPRSIPALVWMPVATAVIAAAAISRARPWALWSARLVVPALTAAALPAAGLPAAPVLAAGVAVPTVLSWKRAVGLSVSPLIPERATAVPFPPELVDPDLLEAAGYDERGRPLEGP